MTAFQTCPSGHSHQTLLVLPAVTISGVSAPLSVGCHSAAMRLSLIHIYAVLDSGNEIILNGRIAILIYSLYEQCHSFVVRKKGSYHKNKPFRLLAVAALFFVQSYLNDIARRGSITTHLYCTLISIKRHFVLSPLCYITL